MQCPLGLKVGWTACVRVLNLPLSAGSLSELQINPARDTAIPELALGAGRGDHLQPGTVCVWLSRSWGRAGPGRSFPCCRAHAVGRVGSVPPILLVCCLCSSTSQLLLSPLFASALPFPQAWDFNWVNAPAFPKWQKLQFRAVSFLFLECGKLNTEAGLINAARAELVLCRVPQCRLQHVLHCVWHSVPSAPDTRYRPPNALLFTDACIGNFPVVAEF